jgi:hypothetical protein
MERGLPHHQIRCGSYDTPHELPVACRLSPVARRPSPVARRKEEPPGGYTTRGFHHSQSGYRSELRPGLSGW